MRFKSGTGRRRMSIAVPVIAALAMVFSLSAASPALAITPDDCATARSFGETQTDVEIAADVALAADAILEAVPQDTLDAGPRAAAVTAWAIPQSALRGIEHNYNIAQACDDNDHQQLVKDNLDAKVSTRATQTSLNTLQATVTSFRTAFDAQKTLDLRLKIEANLADTDTASPIGLFELPAAAGGFIELARSIAADTISKMNALGEQVFDAARILASGDAYLSAHKYRLAYQLFGKAYRAASDPPPVKPTR
jgi:hypothetical protein